MNLPLTALDILVILTILVSVGYAAWRGFLSETLTIFDWLAAAFGCLYFGPYLVPMARGFISTDWLASLVAYAVVFLAIFIPLSFMSHRFSESVRNSVIGPLDRALGIAFGVVRGLVIVALAYLGYTYIEPIPQQPRWVKEARTLPMIQATGDVLIKLIPSQSRGLFVASGHNEEAPRQDDAIGNLIRENSAANQVPPAQREPETARNRPAKKGYGAADRRALDQILQNGGGK